MTDFEELYDELTSAKLVIGKQKVLGTFGGIIANLKRMEGGHQSITGLVNCMCMYLKNRTNKYWK